MTREVPKGSVAAGTRVKLPDGAEPPIEVYVNSVLRKEGEDYRIDRGHVVFPEPIIKEQVSGARWFAMFLGLFGSYGMNEVVDVHYRRGGEVKVQTDAEILP